MCSACTFAAERRAQKRLALCSKESMSVDIRRSSGTPRRTLGPGDRIDPGLELVRGPIGWFLRDAKGSKMTIKLKDTELVMLSAAAQRGDRCLVAAPSLKGAAAQKFAKKLISAGLVREIKLKGGEPAWRRDEATGQPFALKLTAAGAKAIAVDPDEAAGAGADDERSEIESATAPASEPLRPVVAVSPKVAAAARSNANRRAPRAGSKLARAIEVLRSAKGMTIAELAGTMNWLPHTTRAALTGLRKRGYAVNIDRSDKARGSAYRIAEDAALVAWHERMIQGDQLASGAEGEATDAAVGGSAPVLFEQPPSAPAPGEPRKLTRRSGSAKTSRAA